MPGRANVSTFSFFFSSRRRHTRCSRDWSSDVCSSDLVVGDGDGPAGAGAVVDRGWVGGGVPGSGLAVPAGGGSRSGERRVGKEGRSRGAPFHLKKKKRSVG